MLQNVKSSKYHATQIMIHKNTKTQKRGKSLKNGKTDLPWALQKFTVIQNHKIQLYHSPNSFEKSSVKIHNRTGIFTNCCFSGVCSFTFTKKNIKYNRSKYKFTESSHPNQNCLILRKRNGWKSDFWIIFPASSSLLEIEL